MTGRSRSSVDSKLTQQNIGKFVNSNTLPRERKTDKGRRTTGIESLDQIAPSTTKQLGQHQIALKKRTRPSSKSPEEVRKPPPKKQYKKSETNTMTAPIQTSNMNTNESDKVTDFASVEKRLLDGFASMIQREIEPLKQDIKEMKEERLLTQNISLNSCESINRKFNQADTKHRKLQDRISYLEDQLLEKNVIFQGILESEFEDTKDINTGVVKAISTTMTGESDEDKLLNAGQTSIESVERLGKYNPRRTRPVKVRFGDKRDVDHLFKNRKNLPKGIYIDKEYSKSTEKERAYYDQ